MKMYVTCSIAGHIPYEVHFKVASLRSLSGAAMKCQYVPQIVIFWSPLISSALMAEGNKFHTYVIRSVHYYDTYLKFFHYMSYQCSFERRVP